MTFKTQLATDMDAFFNTDEFAESVTYTPFGGSAQTITARLTDEDPTIQTPAPSKDSAILIVKYSDSTAPAKGDTFTINSETWYLVEIVQGGRSEGVWHLRISRSARRDLGGR